MSEMYVEVQAGSVIVDAAAVAHASRHKHGGLDEVASATPSANVIPKADATGKLAAGFIPTGLVSGGVSTLDDLSDGSTYKRILAAIATALNAGTYDAASVATRGIGTATPPAMVTSCDTYNIGGLYTDSGALTNSPWSGSASRILVLPISTTNVTQLAFRNGANHIRIREYAASGWTAWKEVWTADSDGNGGQPPAPKPRDSSGNLGDFKAITALAGSALNAPAGGKWAAIPYYMNASSVMYSGISASQKVYTGGAEILGAAIGYTPWAIVWRTE